MAKSPDAFRTISEVAEWLGVQAHVLRFWESKFTQVKPVKRAGGRRYYRPVDMQLLGGIKRLLHDDGMTIKGVQKMLREQGVAHVQSFSQGLDETAADEVVESGTVIRFTEKQPDNPAQIPASATQIDLELEPQPDPPDTDAPDTDPSTIPAVAELLRTIPETTAPEPVTDTSEGTPDAAIADAEPATDLADATADPGMLADPAPQEDQGGPRPLVVDIPDPLEDAFQGSAPGLIARVSTLQVTAENRDELIAVAQKLRDWCRAQNNVQTG